VNDLRAIVVDDEPPARDELVFLLGECGGVEVVGQAANASQAMDICDGAELDVAFVDLRMPGPDGLALAEALLARDPRMSVVVVSAHDDGALRAFDARVLDYLLKPVRLERLQRALDRVRNGRPKSEPPGALTRLAVRRKGAFVVVDLADVIWFEMQDELVWAVTETDRFALDLTLAAVEQRVPAADFFRSHRSALVRIDRIVAMEPSGAGTYDLVMSHPDRPRVPLARERARMLREIIPIAG
jgi:DNA-binding LytR/AlgR family response regulator